MFESNKINYNKLTLIMKQFIPMGDFEKLNFVNFSF